MPWFKTDDKLHDHRKARRALRGDDVRRDPAAIGLWTLAGSWCAEQLSETGDPDPGGWVPADELGRWADHAEELAQRLVDADLWHRETLAGEDGYRFHDWADFQPTRDKVRADREAARDRMARVRGKSPSGAPAVRANSGGTSINPVPVPVVPNGTTEREPDHFDAFWSEYPRKIGKAAAAKAYAKATKDTPAERVLDGLRNAVQVWRSTGTEDKFIPHASTWLNAGRWDDEVPLPSMPGQPGPSRPSKTLAQCSAAGSHPRHDWSDARNAFVCMGVDA